MALFLCTHELLFHQDTGEAGGCGAVGSVGAGADSSAGDEGELGNVGATGAAADNEQQVDEHEDESLAKSSRVLHFATVDGAIFGYPVIHEIEADYPPNQRNIRQNQR
jgi:hypothetical protein